MVDYISEILRAYEKVSCDQLLYCGVCLRTEDERRLVQPRAFKQFAQSLNRGYKYVGNMHICYICETHAASALRFQMAVNFALSIHILYGQMKLRKKYLDDVRMHLNKLKLNTSKHFQSIDEWEQQLKNIRAQSQLLQTEVLIVDSLGVQTNNDVQINSSGMYVMPEGPPEILYDSECESLLPDAPEHDQRPPDPVPLNDSDVISVDDDDDEDIMCLPISTNNKESTRRVGTKNHKHEAADPPYPPTHQVWLPQSHKIKVVQMNGDHQHVGLGHKQNSTEIVKPIAPAPTKVPLNKLHKVPRVHLTPSPNISKYNKPKPTKQKTPIQDLNPSGVIIIAEENNPSMSVGGMPPPLARIPEVSAPKLVPIENLLEQNFLSIINNVSSTSAPGNQVSYIIRPEVTSQNFLLHPIVTEPNGVLSVPTLSAKIIDGQLVPNKDVFQVTTTGQHQNMLRDTINTSSLVIKGTSQGAPAPIVMQNNAKTFQIVPELLPDVSPRELQKGLLEAETKNKTENVRKRPPEKTNVGKNKLVRQDTAAGPRDPQVVKVPLKNTDRIDWEDQIPMDVISFMDSTGPAAGGLGVISDVRSLPAAAPPPPPPRRDVIDLC